MDDDLLKKALGPFAPPSNNMVYFILSLLVKITHSLANSHQDKGVTSVAEMASMTMTASLLAGSTLAKQPSSAPRRGLVVVKASKATERQRANLEMKAREESSTGRRDLLFAAAAAAAYSIAKVAMAEDEPKPGTPEAKKKYAPICVTMPTARICHK